MNESFQLSIVRPQLTISVLEPATTKLVGKQVSNAPAVEVCISSTRPVVSINASSSFCTSVGDFRLSIGPRPPAVVVGGSGNQEVFIDEQPAIAYPAISFEQVAGYPGLYCKSVHVP